ncbi:histidine kinase/DNA gyrase B/HSP90-like ATPase [Litorimonas taeanensis]|uniref:Histidine kinase/DNA gyrase B/HSP90-like ATPase n=1 Tax=Litorimonas taeanensis TaxID=568099 RepID=A0A420WCZ3_9PROT|nr:ATP-binding protein [Litorimonas taeanensis]RKQ68848.1 histidine kinase/DNA gyrase B/HSP90-like ATPase [Litorimonas taeanensis]
MLDTIGDNETLSLAAKQDFVKKTVNSSNPVKVISELIWNSLDADASNVFVTTKVNELGGVDEITVKDDGTGINTQQAVEAFQKVGGSWKAQKQTTVGKRALHGKEGKGRLHFHSIAGFANWESVSMVDGTLEAIAIEIKSLNLEKTEITKIPVKGDKTGTIAKLSALSLVFDELDHPEIITQLSHIFAPYLIRYSGVQIHFNGVKLNPNIDIENRRLIPEFKVTSNGKTIVVNKVDLVIWKRSNDERKIYYGSRPGVILDSQPANVTAPGISFSAYAYSDYFNEAHEKGLLGLGDLNEPILIETFEKIRERLNNVFREIQANLNSGLIEEYKKKGIYPYKQDPQNAAEKAEQEVFAVTTRVASTYSKTFREAHDSQKEMMLSLLKQAFISNPDSLTTILSAVFGLPKNKQDDFADLLEKTELVNIVETAQFIYERITIIEVLKKVVFDKDLRKHVKERGQLDTLIQNNTWLFGENFHITLHEAGLTRIMNRVCSDMGKKRKGRKPVKTIKGKSARVDTFLGRSVPHPDAEKKEFLVIELKAPKIKLTKKEADQIENYALTLSKQHDFKGTNTDWNFYLIGTEYDDYVRDKITEDNRPQGVFYIKNGVTIWIKTWAEIIRACEGRLAFIQMKLNLTISDEEIKSRIDELTAKIAPRS